MAAARSPSLSLLLVASSWVLAGTNSLVGPGAVGSYQGGGGGRRHGGYVRVQDPSVAFFVAGSSIRELNGLYGRVEGVPSSLPWEFQLAYRHDYTGWHLGLVTASEDVRHATGRNTEWLLIDNDGSVRFRHDGDTLIPGSGRRWSHTRRATSEQQGGEGTADGRATGTAVSTPQEEDFEELPWQLIGVGAQSMLEKLRQYFRFYKHSVQRAIAGDDLPPIPPVPWGGSGDAAPPADLELPAEAGETGLCADASSKESLRRSIDVASKAGSKWLAAALSLRLATDCRHIRSFEEASSLVASALDLFPRYKDALMERGRGYLDRGLYEEAKHTFAVVLHLDREYPSISEWLVRANAHLERQRASAEMAGQGLHAQETAHCLAWRQTGGCDPEGPREPSSDRGCGSTVDPGLSGFCECRGAVGSAAKSSCDHRPFRCADRCREKFDLLDDVAKAQVLSDDAGAPSSDADPCEASSPPDWCDPNHYMVLGVRCDIAWNDGGVEAEELKRAYKKRSLQVHPDKVGGSTRAFQRVALAHEVLSDPERRRKFDEGDELKRERQQDGSEGPSHRQRVEREFFPERFDFEPFGDPHGDRKEHAAAEKRRLERRRQDALARGGNVEL